MNKSKAELEQAISACVAFFLDEQMGEHARAVTAHLSGDTVTVRATGCLAPGERTFVHDEQGWRMFQQFKDQQFRKVRPQLEEQLEKLTASKVLEIVSVLDQNGIRVEVVTLSRSFEN
jgi:uncharacterized protein YbcI